MADARTDAKTVQDKLSLGKRLAEIWRSITQARVWGELRALGRQGSKDLHNAIAPAFPESVRSQDEPGTPLVPTQYMVTKSVGGYDAELTAAAARGRASEEVRSLSRD